MANGVLLWSLLIGFFGNLCFGDWHSFENDHYGSYYKKRDISKIPQLGDADPRVNLVGEKTHNDYYMTKLVKETGYKTTVFKIKMERTRIVLADSVAIHAIYDDRKVEKTLSGGSLEFNLISTGGYHPSFLDNGRSHKIKKKRQYRLMRRRLQTFGLDNVFKYMGRMFAGIKPIDSSSPVDITSQIDQITQDTMIKLLLGAPLKNPALFNKWFLTSFKIIKELDPNYGVSDEAYKKIFEEMMAFIRTTPVVKGFRHKSNFAELEKEMMFFTIWLAAAGVVLGQKASLKFYAELSKEDLSLIEDDAGKFFACLQRRRNFNACFSRLDSIDRFVMEVLRLESPVANVRARARKDFVLTSLHGRFQIKKGDWIQGSVLTAQRGPEFFKDHAKFDMHRNQRNTKKNFFAFGGPYHQKPTLRNHKCLGQSIATSFMKMFILHLTQCDTKLGPLLQSPTKTGGVLINASKFDCRNK